MRAPAVLLLLATTLLASACATRFQSGPLRPIPRAAAAPGLPYAQVREYAVSTRFHWIYLSFAGSRPRPEAAVTVDVRNDTGAPLLLELSRARLRVEGSGGKTSELAVVSAGFGNVPRSIDLSAPGEPALELAPGEGRTIWLAFAAPSATEARTARLVVVVPVTAAGEVAVTVDDDFASPDWILNVTSAFGLTLGTGARYFDSGRGRFNHVEAAFFHTRGAVTTSLAVGGFTLHERLRGGIAHAGGPSFSGELAFRPLDSALGGFASVQHLRVDFDTGAGEPDRSLFGATAGLLLPLAGGIAPVASLRLGYTYLFGDETPYKDGLFAAVEVRLFFN